ncbi:hypothetical protein CCP3SC1AL1_760016 [Gammaproteobacteria bacterium]
MMEKVANNLVDLLKRVKKALAEISKLYCLRLNRNGFSTNRSKPTDLTEDDSLRRIAESMDWIELYCEPAKTAEYFSYSLKHAVEEASDYTTNGEAIMAAILLGYQPIKIQGPNCYFRIKGKFGKIGVIRDATAKLRVPSRSIRATANAMAKVPSFEPNPAYSRGGKSLVDASL